jgi:hypothetical protein
MKKLLFFIVLGFSTACTYQDEISIAELENKSKPISSKCTQNLILSFDTQDEVIEYGQGWQGMQPNSFKLEWQDDTSLKIKSFHNINQANMLQCTSFPIQNYDIFYVNNHEIIVELHQPTLWEIYGEHYHLFKIKLNINVCKRQLIKF